MAMIIILETKRYQQQNNRQYPATWGDKPCIAVPPRLEPRATVYCPYCDLVIEDGVLVDILPLAKPEPLPPEPTPIEVLQSENKLLKEQVSALSEQNDFQEELIVELANVVYA